LNIAVAIEDPEGFSMLEDTSAIVRHGGTGEDIKLIIDADNLFHKNLRRRLPD
jgi:hypothetical protein